MAEPTISFGGIASGLDTKAIIAALSAINKKPIDLLQNKASQFAGLKQRYEQLRGKLQTLQDTVSDIAKSTDLLSFSATSSNTNILTATASGSAAAGSFNVAVNALAKAQVSTSAGFADYTTTSAGTGDLKFTIGSTTTTISIASGKDTLEKVRDAINDAKFGVTATIVSEGTGTTPYKLVLQSNKTGTDNAFTIDATAFTGTLALGQTQGAANASISINGLTLTRQSNVVSDVVPGVTLNLLSQNASPVTVTLNPDYGAIETKIQKYVDSQSDLVSFINSQIAAVNNQGGWFNGESTVRNIKNGLLQLTTAGSLPGGSNSTLASIGISLDKDGTLNFDKTKFETAAKSNLDGVTNLMTKLGKSFDTDGFTLYTPPTNLGSGTYNVQVTQVATKATTTAGAAYATLAQEEKLTFKQNGKTVDITLAAGTTLANAVTKIQTDLQKAKFTLNVTDSGGSLKFTASAFGSKYGFSVQSNVAAGAGTSGVGTTLVNAAGVDAAGTINGVALTGDGQQLKGTSTSDYKGLEFRYTGTTVPANSKLTLGADGFFVKLKARLTNVLASVSGPIAARVDGLGKNIDNISDRIDELTKRNDQYEELLRKRFTALEQIIGRLQEQQSYIAAVKIGTG